MSDDARVREIVQAALAVCHAWRDNATATDRVVVKALIDPIAALGRTLASPTIATRKCR